MCLPSTCQKNMLIISCWFGLVCTDTTLVADHFADRVAYCERVLRDEKRRLVPPEEPQEESTPTQEVCLPLQKGGWEGRRDFKLSCRCTVFGAQFFFELHSWRNSCFWGLAEVGEILGQVKPMFNSGTPVLLFWASTLVPNPQFFPSLHVFLTG